MTKYFYIYLIIINMITFFMYSYDKKLSKLKNVRRISEKTLLILSLIGGALGGYFAMILKHHKTKHWYFTLVNILGIVAYSLVIYYINKISCIS